MRGQKRSACVSAKRASAQAAPAVSAIAARQVKSWRAQALDEIGQQRAFAGLALAEEMAAAGDVEQQAGIAAEAAGAAGFGAFLGDGAAQRIDRHPGRVAVAPVGERLDQAAVGLRLDRPW